ncbi:unnamed protein product [Prorocentrum cordatum]|uniref:Uncharacterized protein n=1 Tax=Prorocentrum cordatum TaxID=2364126 RepID=A0ABN9XVJ3_9DINO|nr:unnamed protein product [Polarella glacialis]
MSVLPGPCHMTRLHRGAVGRLCRSVGPPGDLDVGMARASALCVARPAPEDLGHTLMHWAALSGGFAGVEFLSKAHGPRGPRGRQAAQNGQTPLMWAVIRGHVKAAKVLLDARADPLARDSLGASPLVLCIQHQKPASFLLLARAPRRSRRSRRRPRPRRRRRL